jgi:hypothetical protein
MAGPGKRALKAASMLESIVAMMIIMIAFAIGITVFTQFAFPSLGLEAEKAAQLLDLQLLKMEQAPELLPVDTLVDDLRITATIQPYTGYSKVMQVSAQAMNQQQQVVAQQQLLIIRY